MNNTLTKEELKDFTGSPRVSTQKEILGKNGIRFIVNAKGEVKTTWQAVNSVLVSESRKEEFEPNLDFLRNG